MARQGARGRRDSAHQGRSALASRRARYRARGQSGGFLRRFRRQGRRQDVSPAGAARHHLQLDKDGKIKAIVPVAAAAHGEEGGAGKAAVYYAIDPPLVVNFEDGSVVRFLQITMEVMAHDQKDIDSVQKNIPVIRNNLLLLMSNRNYQSMMSREGKEKLRQEALTEIRAVQ